MRSLAYILSLLISLLLAHTALRFYGYQREYVKRSHPFLKDISNIHPLDFSPEHYPQSLIAAKTACLKPCTLLIDLYWSAEEDFWVLREKNAVHLHLSQNKRLTNTEILTQQKESLPLKDFLEKFPKANFIFRLDINQVQIDKSIAQELDSLVSKDRFVLCSQFGNLARSLRKVRPHWTSCASEDEVVKAQLLSSIYLESIAPFPAELFLIKKEETRKASESFHQEITRRNLWIYEY